MVFLMKRVSTRLGGLWVLYHAEGSSRLHGAVRSPWGRFLQFPPAPYSHPTSKVGGKVAAPAAGCASRHSLEQTRNTKQHQTEPSFFPPFPYLF